MKWIAGAITILGLAGMAVYLLMNGYPYWAAAFLLIAACVKVTDQ